VAFGRLEGKDAMSDSLPKPLPSITALRAHLKLLERGVSDARTRRVGPSEPATVVATVPSAPAPAAAVRPAAASFKMTPRPAAASNGKPKARPKSGADFSQFFDGIQQRAAG
jgi:hypothetical protein